MSRLSVILVAGPQRHRAQRVLDALAVQTAADLDVVVVDGGADGAPLRVPAGLRVRTVPWSETSEASWPLARVAGLKAAEHDLVAYIEDHAYPEPEWAAAVLDAFASGPWAAVGYGFRLANTGTYTAAAAHVADYGLWLHPVRDGEAVLLPGNNVAYRRDALLALGDDLVRLFAVDFTTHEALRARGERLALASGAVVRHESYEGVAPLLRANYAYCRVMSASRARTWPLRRRLVYAVAVPLLVPLMKLVRIARAVGPRPVHWPQVLAALPVLVATYVVAAVGEGLGYALGSGEAPETFLDHELRLARTTA